MATRIVASAQMDADPPLERDQVFILVHRFDATGRVVAKEKYKAESVSCGELGPKVALPPARGELTNTERLDAGLPIEPPDKSRPAGDVTIDVNQSMGLDPSVTLDPENHDQD